MFKIMGKYNFLIALVVLLGIIIAPICSLQFYFLNESSRESLDREVFRLGHKEVFRWDIVSVVADVFDLTRYTSFNFYSYIICAGSISFSKVIALSVVFNHSPPGILS